MLALLILVLRGTAAATGERDLSPGDDDAAAAPPLE